MFFFSQMRIDSSLAILPKVACMSADGKRIMKQQCNSHSVIVRAGTVGFELSLEVFTIDRPTA